MHTPHTMLKSHSPEMPGEPRISAPGWRDNAGAAQGVAQGHDRRRRHEVIVAADVARDLRGH